jgi:putative endopeptidase
VKQFEAFEALPGLHVNGKLTLGENIGDLTGIAIAYRAYLKSLGGKEAPVLDGFTGPQRFFLGTPRSGARAIARKRRANSWFRIPTPRRSSA